MIVEVIHPRLHNPHPKTRPKEGLAKALLEFHEFLNPQLRLRPSFAASEAFAMTSLDPTSAVASASVAVSVPAESSRAFEVEEYVSGSSGLILHTSNYYVGSTW